MYDVNLLSFQCIKMFNLPFIFKEIIYLNMSVQKSDDFDYYLIIKSFVQIYIGTQQLKVFADIFHVLIAFCL